MKKIDEVSGAVLDEAGDAIEAAVKLGYKQALKHVLNISENIVAARSMNLTFADSERGNAFLSGMRAVNLILLECLQGTEKEKEK